MGPIKLGQKVVCFMVRPIKLGQKVVCFMVRSIKLGQKVVCFMVNKSNDQARKFDIAKIRLLYG